MNNHISNDTNNYIKITAFFSLLICGIVAGINGLINPFIMFNTPALPGINEFYTECYYKQLLFKPYQLRDIQPRSIIIGASHAGIAFNPDKLPQPAYNLAVGGASSYINFRLLQEAIGSNDKLENVILETPFFSFNSDDPNNQPHQDAQFEGRLLHTSDMTINPSFIRHYFSDKLASLLSWESLRASLRMLGKQRDVGNKTRSSFIEKTNGQWLQQTTNTTTTWTLFENSWRKFLYDEWFPAPQHRFTFSLKGAPINYYRQSLKLLYARNIHTRIVIAPLHGSLLIALQEAGIGSDFDSWKAALVSINEEEAALAGKTAFAVYDYAIISAYTSQPLPEQHSSTQRLSWFNDSAHASPLLGDLIMREWQESLSVSGGMSLDNSNITQHLAQTTATLAEYRNSHPEIHQAIQQLIKSAPADIHFPSRQ
jgi:hypothetical protein